MANQRLTRIKLRPLQEPSDLRPDMSFDGWERRFEPEFEGFMHAYQPCVVEVPDTSYPYRMWFFGWVTDIGNADVPGCDATYFARGKDLDHWEVLCKDGSWDAGKHNEQWVSVLHASPDADKQYPFFRADDYNRFYDQIRYMRHEIVADR